MVQIDFNKIRELDTIIIYNDLIDENNNFLRHDPVKLAKVVIDLIAKVSSNKGSRINHVFSGETFLQWNNPRGKGIYQSKQ